MSELVLSRRSASLAGNADIPLILLSDAGLDALFQRGWDGLRHDIGEPRAWFRGRSLRDRPDEDASALLPGPFEVDLQRADDEVRCLLFVHPEVRWFEGHFPERPILPGVAQIDWAGHAAVRYGAESGTFTGMSGIKFMRPVLPGTVLRMTLGSTPGRWSFLFESNAGVCSRGMLHYRA